MIELIKDILQSLTAEYVALISVVVTILLFIIGKYNELKFKKHELKKEKYMQFINLLKETYLSGGDFNLNEEWKEKFFDFGATIFIYGSKKMYKKYCFFREINSEFMQKRKYYDNKIVLYLAADMLNQIRKEVGMYSFELPLNYKSIAFFTNDIYFNPNINCKWWNSKLNVFLIKFELLLCKIEEMVLLKILVKFIALPFKMLTLVFKYFFQIPLGKFLINVGLDKKIEELNNKLNSKNQ